MRVVGYVRVSTDKQAEHGFGLDVQERTIKTWCRAQRHRLVYIYRDEGVSGSNGLDSRVGLADALEAIKAKEAGALVVARLDRLARDLIVQEQVLAEARRLGGDVLSCVGGEAMYLVDDPDDPSRKLIRQVLGAVSEYEKSIVALRLRSGRKRKAERGEYAYGSPPLGKRAKGGKLVDDKEESETVARIVELHGEGKSLRAIAAVLEEEGRQTKRGGRWQPETLARVIRRESVG